MCENFPINKMRNKLFQLVILKKKKKTKQTTGNLWRISKGM